MKYKNKLFSNVHNPNKSFKQKTRSSHMKI